MGCPYQPNVMDSQHRCRRFVMVVSGAAWRWSESGPRVVYAYSAEVPYVRNLWLDQL